MIKILIDDWFKDHFQSGDTIQGKVQCLVQDADFVEVQVKLLGAECTFRSLVAKAKSKDDRRWKNYFFESESLVLHSGDIDVGPYEFPFDLTLPIQMAGSYSGEHGYVKFFIIAKMIRNNTETREDRTEVKVFSPVDLNYQAHTRIAACTHFDQLTLEKWWCIPEFAEMEVRLEKNAFVLGETMKINVDVQNNSSVSVSSVNAKLVLRIQAKVSPPTGDVVDTFQCLAVCQRKGFRTYNMKTYYIDMKIPKNIELPNFKECNQLSLKAFLEVTTVLNTSSMLKVEVFVVLGHIPHKGQKSQFTSAQETENRVHSTISSSLKGGLFDRPRSMPSLRGSKEKVHKSSNEKISSRPTSPLVPPYPATQHFNVSLPDVPTYPPVLSQNPREGIQMPLSLYKEHKIAPYPTQMPLLPTAYDKPNPPYPTEGSCPYPTERPKVFTPYPTESFNKSAPYTASAHPRNLEEREEDVLLPIKMPMPIGFHHDEGPPYPSNVGSDEDLHTKMPSLPLFTKVDAHPPYPLSRSEVNPPYPVEQRTTKTAPYPIESFSGMPMPSKCSPIPCDTIGFAVPTSVASDIHLPSAPPLSEIQTPPIAKVEELNDPLDMHFADASSNDASDVEYSSLPELPSPPTEEVEEERTAEGTAASSQAPLSYEETTPPTKVKKKRTKKEKALAS